MHIGKTYFVLWSLWIIFLSCLELVSFLIFLVFLIYFSSFFLICHVFLIFFYNLCCGRSAALSDLIAFWKMLFFSFYFLFVQHFYLSKNTAEKWPLLLTYWELFCIRLNCIWMCNEYNFCGTIAFTDVFWYHCIAKPNYFGYGNF